MKLTKRPVSSKRSDSKTRSVVVAILPATALRIIFSKATFSCFHVLLLYEYSYCLNEWSPFDQVSRSFCDLTTRTRLLAYMKYPGNMQLNRLRGLRINSLTSSRSKATVINCFTALRCPKECFRTLVSSPIITLNFQRGMRVIQPVTSQRCFGRAKMAANFKLNRSTSNCWKSSFRSLHAKKKSAVFPSKVQTLLLSKNLTCENFISVAL